jgi:NAD(P)-dependent dehydrogenase (short-subunit alcohol dehydrogenase family)
VVLADLQAELAAEVADGICAGGGRASASRLDVTDFDAVANLVRQTADRCGRLDYLFNNAGIGVGGEARLYELEHWYRVLDVNLRGVIHGTQAAYPLMLEQGYGHIVNTASLAGLIPTGGLVGYCATKHAVVGLSKTLRIEAAGAGVRVSVLCPGVIRTPILENGGKYGEMLEPIPPEALQRLLKRLHPMDPDRFAQKALNAIAKNKAVIVVPWWWKIVWWVHRASPSLGLYLARLRFEITKKVLKSARKVEGSSGSDEDGATDNSK